MSHPQITSVQQRAQNLNHLQLNRNKKSRKSSHFEKLEPPHFGHLVIKIEFTWLFFGLNHENNIMYLKIPQGCRVFLCFSHNHTPSTLGRKKRDTFGSLDYQIVVGGETLFHHSSYIFKALYYRTGSLPQEELIFRSFCVKTV